MRSGFPHSEISGSKLVHSSPKLIAAYHVLHRLSAPRHPPNALKALDRSHDRCPRDQLAKTRSERPLCLPNRSDLTRTIGDRTLACCRMSSSRTYSLFTMTNSVTHRRALRQSAKPDKFRVSGGARRDRTDDLKLAKLPLSQLSSGPILEKGHAPRGAAAGRPCGLVVRHAWQSLVGLGGLEPPTSRLSSARSNQLSYRPEAHDLEDTLAVRPKT